MHSIFKKLNIKKFGHHENDETLTKLMQAAWDKDYHHVKKYLSYIHDRDYKNKQYGDQSFNLDVYLNQLLMIACKPFYNDPLLIKMINLLIKKGADPNVVCHDPELRYISRYVPEMKNKNPLMYTAYLSKNLDKGYEDKIAFLLKAGADPNIQSPQDGKTALMYYVHRELETGELCILSQADANIVKELLIAGADPNIKDYEGNTALTMIFNQILKKLVYEATSADMVYDGFKNDMDIVSLLLRNGARLSDQVPVKDKHLNDIVDRFNCPELRDALQYAKMQSKQYSQGTDALASAVTSESNENASFSSAMRFNAM